LTADSGYFAVPRYLSGTGQLTVRAASVLGGLHHEYSLAPADV
jgi:hypothetical protein